MFTAAYIAIEEVGIGRSQELLLLTVGKTMRAFCSVVYHVQIALGAPAATEREIVVLPLKSIFLFIKHEINAYHSI